MADSYKSEQIVIQSIGRLLRLFEGKEEALIFDLVDVFSEREDNVLFRHYLERRSFYVQKKYPFEEKRVRL